MRKKYIILMILFGLFSMSFMPTINDVKEPKESLYKVSMKTLEGNEINFSDYKGKKILFVNVASKCGFTPQYGDLQKLHEQYKDQLVIIGVPCNQFGKQEPGSSEEIATFCEKNYGVSFLITEKVDVKGSNQHQLYQWLTKESKNGSADSSVKWNFQKYLVDEQGRLIGVYSSRVKPFDEQITSKL